jgi:hypothetical protein
MKKIILILFVLVNINAKGQTIKENDLVRISNYQSPTPAKFRLYPTANRYTYLRLNTTNGFIDIVQYSTTNAEDRMIYPLSTTPPLMSLFGKDFGGEPTLDRYTIYPTQNVWNFLLLDQELGNVYQVQWSQDSTMRGVEEILKKSK